jgi:hypothetical protein
VIGMRLARDALVGKAGWLVLLYAFCRGTHPDQPPRYLTESRNRQAMCACNFSSLVCSLA